MKMVYTERNDYETIWNMANPYDPCTHSQLVALVGSRELPRAAIDVVANAYVSQGLFDKMAAVYLAAGPDYERDLRRALKLDFTSKLLRPQ